MGGEKNRSQSATIVDAALNKLYDERSIVFPRSVVKALMIASLGAFVLGEDAEKTVGVLVQSLVEPVKPLLEEKKTGV